MRRHCTSRKRCKATGAIDGTRGGWRNGYLALDHPLAAVHSREQPPEPNVQRYFVGLKAVIPASTRPYLAIVLSACLTPDASGQHKRLPCHVRDRLVSGLRDRRKGSVNTHLSPTAWR
jgi:hypothetical protein